ncbi:hypothetical protein GCM10027061_19890 [Nesterenkonia suensis]
MTRCGASSRPGRLRRPPTVHQGTDSDLDDGRACTAGVDGDTIPATATDLEPPGWQGVQLRAPEDTSSAAAPVHAEPLVSRAFPRSHLPGLRPRRPRRAICTTTSRLPHHICWGRGDSGVHNAGVHNAGVHNAGVHNAGVHNAGVQSDAASPPRLGRNPQQRTGRAPAEPARCVHRKTQIKSGQSH